MDSLMAKMSNAAPPVASSSPSIFHKFYDSLELIFDGLGLMRGTFAPLKRFLFGFGVTTIGVLWIKPGYAFYRGSFRPYKLLGDTQDAPATWTPWWTAPLATGLFLALFI
jgi:hypothetical protein